MADGGFLVKFDGKEVCWCYAISIDYDEWTYKINNDKVQDIPEGIEKIEIIPE